MRGAGLMRKSGKQVFPGKWKIVGFGDSRANAC